MELTMPDQTVVQTAETVPQATEPGAQAPVQAQEVTPDKVESGEQSTTQENSRKASDIETARALRQIRKQLQSFQQTLEKVQSPPPQSSPSAIQIPNLTNEEFVKDPVGNTRKMLEQIIQQQNGVLSQTLQQRERELEFKRSEEEALRMIKTNEFVKNDPQGRIRMQEILSEEDEDGNSLDNYGLMNPAHAAKLALKIYNVRYGAKKSVDAPTKAQMISTATAVTPGNGKIDLASEAAKLHAELAKDSSLLSDPKFRERMAAVVKQGKQEFNG